MHSNNSRHILAPIAEAGEFLRRQKPNADLVRSERFRMQHDIQQRLFIDVRIVLPALAPVSVHGDGALVGARVLVPAIGLVQ